jgi:hypothetical protein
VHRRLSGHLFTSLEPRQKVLQETISHSYIALQRSLGCATHESNLGSGVREIQNRSRQNNRRIALRTESPTKKQVRRQRAHSIRRPLRQENNAAKEIPATESSTYRVVAAPPAGSAILGVHFPSSFSFRTYAYAAKCTLSRGGEKGVLSLPTALSLIRPASWHTASCACRSLHLDRHRCMPTSWHQDT